MKLRISVPMLVYLSLTALLIACSTLCPGGQRGEWMRLDPKPIPGCRHTAADKLRWCDAGSCPVCLHAKLGIAEDQLADIEQAFDDALIPRYVGHEKLTLVERARLLVEAE